jgi:hypothetical protein
MGPALPQVIATSSNDAHTRYNDAHVRNHHPVTYNAPIPWSRLSRILDTLGR